MDSVEIPAESLLHFAQQIPYLLGSYGGIKDCVSLYRPRMNYLVTKSGASTSGSENDRLYQYLAIERYKSRGKFLIGKSSKGSVGALSTEYPLRA